MMTGLATGTATKTNDRAGRPCGPVPRRGRYRPARALTFIGGVCPTRNPLLRLLQPATAL